MMEQPQPKIDIQELLNVLGEAQGRRLAQGDFGLIQARVVITELEATVKALEAKVKELEYGQEEDAKQTKGQKDTSRQNGARQEANEGPTGVLRGDSVREEADKDQVKT